MSFLEATALQLAWYKGKTKATKTEQKQALKLVTKWNNHRKAKGLPEWR